MNKGNYYKRKTKEFFENQGYVVDYIEKLQRIFSRGKIIYVKKDLFASDLIVMSKKELIFVQVKGGKEKTGISVKKAIQEFNKYPFPPFVKRYIVIWRERQREPEIIDLKEMTK